MLSCFNRRKKGIKIMKKSLFLFAFLFALLPLFIVKCSKNIAGGTEVGNPRISAMLYNPGGSPAVHAKIRFFPINYNPRTGGLTVDSTITDTLGNYSAKLDVGTYNILASSDSGFAYQDSIKMVKDTIAYPPADTLKAPGSIRGKIRLKPGDDARTVFIIFMGTNIWNMAEDSIGNFTVANMAEGSYRVRILTTLDAYVPKDTVLSIIAGRIDTLPHDIVLQNTGIPGQIGLAINYDTLKQIVILSWNKPTDGRKVAGYNIYRQFMGSTDSSLVKVRSTWTDTVFYDTTGIQNQTYEYRVAAVDTQGTEGVKSVIASVMIQSAFYIADTILKAQGQAWIYAAEMDGQGNYVIVNGTAYVATPAHIERYTPSGTLINSWSIPGGIEQRNVYNCLAMGDSNTIFVVTKNNMIIHYDTAGTILSQFQAGSVRGFSLFRDTLYIGNITSHSIISYSTAGDSLFAWGQDGQGNSQFKNIYSISCDSSGLIYVEDALDFGRIQIFDRNGAFRSSFDFHQFATFNSVVDLNATQLDIRGNLVLVSGQANNLYAFTTAGLLVFRCQGISSLNRAFYDSNGNIMVSTWPGKILTLLRR
jgi:hypothetical protein